MNHSIYSADRATHLKIVALVAGIAIAGLGLLSRAGNSSTHTAGVVKAGKPMTITRSVALVTR